MKGSLVILAIVIGYGCAERVGLPIPPANQLNEDDRHVLSVAIGAALAAEYGKPTLSEETTVAFIAPDVTIRACELPEYDPIGYDCMRLGDLRAVTSMLSQRFSPRAASLFRERNRSSSRARGSIVGIQLVAGETLLELLRGRWLPQFSAQFPGKRGIVMYSAPVYPEVNHAAVYVLHVVSAASLVELTREQGAWKILAMRGLWIS